MFIPSFKSRFNQFYNLHSHYNYHVYDMDSVFLEATDTDIILVLWLVETTITCILSRWLSDEDTALFHLLTCVAELSITILIILL